MHSAPERTKSGALPTRSLSWIGLPWAFFAASLAILVAVAYATLLPEIWRLALFVAGGLLAAGWGGPAHLLAVLALSAGVSLAPITENQRALLADIGGFNLDGLRLLATVAALGLCFHRLHYLRQAVQRLRPYFAFLLVCAASLAWSSDRTDGLRLLLKLTYPLIGFILAYEVTRIGDSRWVAVCIAIGAVLASAVNGTLEVLNHEPVDEWFSGRYRGGIGYNLMGHYSAITCLGAYAWWRSTRLKTFAILACTLALQCVCTGSRTAYISLGVGILTYELAIGRWRAALALAGSAAVVWVLIPSLGTRTAGNDVLGGMSAQYLAQANLSGRVLIWADVWNGMVSLGEPWGHGLGATAAYLANRYETIRHVHSEYLRLIAEAGVLGLALFLWSYVLLGAQLIRGRIAGQLPLAALALASIVMYLVACAAENMFEVFALYGIFPWIFMGLAFGSEDEGRQRGERTRSKEP